MEDCVDVLLGAVGAGVDVVVVGAVEAGVDVVVGAVVTSDYFK